MSAADLAHAGRFRDAIAAHIGIYFDDPKLSWLADVLNGRRHQLAETPDTYLGRLETGRPGELATLAEILTVGETYFFRNADHHRALVETVLAARLAATPHARHLRILSAGCASGEEAYTLAMLVRDVVDPSWNVSITGVDINPAAIAKARRGRYSAWALRDTPADARQRWFTLNGSEFVLDDAIRRAVTFDIRNLAVDDAELWQAESYDIVFFRNVLMYFTREHAEAAVGRAARALKRGGYLFLGHAETLRGLSNDFDLRHTHGTFYYQRKDAHPAGPPTWADPPRTIGVTTSAVATGDAAWLDAIQQATDRIEALTRAGLTATGSPAAPLTHEIPRFEPATLFGLLREERYTEALSMLQGLPQHAAGHGDALLLEAALHVHDGRLDSAEAACQRVIDVDRTNAGAHYLLALCRDAAEDTAGADYHDHAAIDLDPSFAMPHLHLGLRARRAGDHDAARREFGRALPLLEKEDATRLLLFGGGFAREALMALCRAQLAPSHGRVAAKVSA